MKHKTNQKDQGLTKTPQTQRELEAHPPKVVDSCSWGHVRLSEFLDYGGRDDVDAKVLHFLYACGIPFNVLRSPYWHEMVEAICTAPTRYKSPGYDKARTMGLDKEKGKIQNALGKFKNSWNEYGVSIV